MTDTSRTTSGPAPGRHRRRAAPRTRPGRPLPDRGRPPGRDREVDAVAARVRRRQPERGDPLGARGRARRPVQPTRRAAACRRSAWSAPARRRASASEHAAFTGTLLAAGTPHTRRDVYLVELEPGSVRQADPHIPGSVEHLVVAAGPYARRAGRRHDRAGPARLRHLPRRHPAHATRRWNPAPGPCSSWSTADASDLRQGAPQAQPRRRARPAAASAEPGRRCRRRPPLRPPDSHD